MHYWILRDERRIIAGCGVIIEGKSAHLCWGVVHRDHQGKGVGKELLEYRLRWVRENAPTTEKVVCETAPLTKSFYAKYGFIETGTEPDYWAPGFDLVKMELVLR